MLPVSLEVIEAVWLGDWEPLGLEVGEGLPEIVSVTVEVALVLGLVE